MGLIIDFSRKIVDLLKFILWAKLPKYTYTLMHFNNTAPPQFRCIELILQLTKHIHQFYSIHYFTKTIKLSGILGSSPLQTVEKLDIRANKWVYVSKMSVPRVDAGAGSITIIWYQLVQIIWSITIIWSTS